jgi:hypothetical protein
MTTTKTTNETLAKIAAKFLNVDSFASVGHDAADFVEVSRELLGEALAAAFEAGRNSKS